MIIKVKIFPKSKKNQIVGFQKDYLKIKINAVPEKGKANLEFIRFFAKTLSISKRSITILSGHTTQIKKIQVDGVSEKDFLDLIGQAI